MGLSVIVTSFYGVPIRNSRLREIYRELGIKKDFIEVGVKIEVSSIDEISYVVVGEAIESSKMDVYDLILGEPTEEQTNHVRAFCERWGIDYVCKPTTVVYIG